jgi:hypothetical protein
MGKMKPAGVSKGLHRGEKRILKGDRSATCRFVDTKESRRTTVSVLGDGEPQLIFPPVLKSDHTMLVVQGRLIFLSAASHAQAA